MSELLPPGGPLETRELLVLERARDYVRRGFSVIPLEPCGKKPVVAWKEFQSRRPTDAELAEWCSRPGLNLGIVTGAISGITVLDTDSAEAVRRASDLGLPTCPQVRTAKGWHFYFAYEPGVGNFQKRDDLPGIDLRGDGGYVVAPPSRHETGAIYRWEGESRPLPPLPPWVLARSVQTSVPRAPVGDLYAGAVVGRRNDSLARLVGAWAGVMAFEFALAGALFWNSRNQPPLDDREVERTVRSIYAKEQAKQSELAGAGWQASAPAVDVDPDAPLEGIIRVADLQQELADLYRYGLPPGVTTGWDAIDGSSAPERLYSVRRGEWTLVTGIPGHGKSSWLDQLMIQVAEQHGWRFAVFSAENLPIQRHVASLLEKLLDKPFNEGPTARINADDLQRGLPWLHEHFFFLAPHEDRQNLRTLLSLADSLIEREGITGIVIDPWNELDHSRPGSVTETEYISTSLSTIRRFARAKNVHVFVVAHPAKMLKENGKYPVPTPYDVSGSAHWRNKADNAIAVYRNDGEAVGTNSIFIQKIRFREVGKVGVATLFYNNVTGRFTDSRYGRYMG